MDEINKFIQTVDGVKVEELPREPNSYIYIYIYIYVDVIKIYEKITLLN